MIQSESQNLYSSFTFHPLMEQQMTLSTFQKPFDLDNRSSLKSSSVVPNLSQEAEQILYGSLLGDGHIGRIRGKNTHYSESHCIEQEEYLLWKEKILSNFFSFRRNYRSWFDPRFNEKFKFNRNFNQICITSKVSPYLTKLRKIFYPNGKKQISNQILEKLKPLGLAVWYCDDGSYCYRGKSIKIATQCFGRKGCELIKGWFEDRLGIQININKKNEISFNRNATQKFINLIEKYVPQSMNYKLGKDFEKVELAKIKNKKSLSEYYNKNLDKIKKQVKEIYYPKNRDKILKIKKGYYVKNKPEISEKRRIYHSNNRDKLIKKSRNYYMNNREKLLQQKGIYYQANSESIKFYQKEYRKNNKNKIKKLGKNYYKNNKDKIAKWSKEYYFKNREKILKQKKEYYKRKSGEKQ